MKNYNLLRLLPASLAVMLVLTLSCSEDKSADPQPIDPNPVENSDISFSITSGDGSNTTSGPIVAEDGNTASVSISQKSSYTDTDGEVYVCEPKATSSFPHKSTPPLRKI